MISSIRTVILLISSSTVWSQNVTVLPQPDLQTFDYLTRSADKHLETRAREVAIVSNLSAARERQAAVRTRISVALGKWPEKTPLNPRISGVLQRDGYRIEKLIFESRPRFFVTGNLYLPEGSPPFPALLGAAGHADEGKSVDAYQRVWISMAKRGFVVFAWDPIEQGERLDYIDQQTGKPRIRAGTQQHVMTGLPVLLTGDSLAGYFVWDGIRALDYLMSRKEVDPRRIAVGGNSGGGTHAAMMGAIEPRLAAIVSSCYMTSSAALWRGHGPADSEQLLPSFISSGLDYSDFALAAAPRSFLIESAIRDFFPIDGARATWRQARRFYEFFGHPDRMGMFEYDDEHGWFQPRREAAYRWLERLFYGRESAPEDTNLKVEPASELAATRTGQAVTSMSGETVQSLNRKRGDALFLTRTALRVSDSAALRRMIIQRLAISNDPSNSKPSAAELGVVQRNGYSIRKLVLTGREGLRLPALLFQPEPAQGNQSAILYFNSDGMAKDSGENGPIEQLVRSGNIVLAMDTRGFGELRHDPAKDPFTRHGAYKISMRAMLVGKTLIGMAVEDLQTGLDYLANLTSIGGGDIGGAGAGNAGIGMLYLAALDERVKTVTVHDAPVSYQAYTAADEHTGLADIVVPGVLGDFDLPDLVKAIAPRKIVLSNIRSANGVVLSAAQIREYWPNSEAVRIKP